MLRFISIPSFLIFFFSLFLILYSTHGISFPFNSSLQPDGVKFIVDKQVDEELSWMAWRSLVVEGVQENKTFVLAQERTLRKDVFNHFKRYTGGWNISNPEYISSVLSTAVPFFVVAATWLVVFGLVLHIICVCYCCCPRDPHGFSQLVCYATFIFLILCTIVAIGGCVVLYTSEQQFHGTTSNTMKYIVSQAEFTIENLKNVTNYLDSAKMMAIEFGLPDDVDEEIDSVKKKIIDVAADISIKTHNNSQMLHNAIHGMRLALIIIVTSMLIVLVLGFFTSILGLKYTLYSLVFAGWILVAGTFILCGAFVFLHK
ncbi:hypothetical protein MtrunA17_Chr4g0065031 [Medicago truncatula]|uniref:Transmembrane protein n=1 Tax=Medicago truncatula TaxID=3880 RepID=A0A396IGZ0_MEDTR|nr:hypothetical protein MtrunA17_Chr4g0065031 [Medicago truncatula]